jgi:hypothetical protein
MSAMITSVIKTDSSGQWYIELTDLARAGSTEICLDIDEYAQKIESLGYEHGGEIQVLWSADSDVTPIQIHEVRQQIMVYEAGQETLKEASSQNQ